MTDFKPGDFLPEFSASSNVNPRFEFDLVSGNRTLLLFAASTHAGPGRQLVEDMLALLPLLRRKRVYCFLVVADPRCRTDGSIDAVLKRHTVFWDHDLRIHRAYGMVGKPSAERAGAPTLRLGGFLIRENRRMAAFLPSHPLQDFRARLAEALNLLPDAIQPRPAPPTAPVLEIPGLFNEALCRDLIRHYESGDTSESGFMREVDGRTRAIMDDRIKKRRDCIISDAALQSRILHRLRDFVVPEVLKAFCFTATRLERFLVACYDSANQGFFAPHRDNRTSGTAHRRFAITVNLNDDYDGGGLRFGEYSADIYRPGAGCAVVFSCSLLHEAMPVTRGRRYVFLPFLYDNAAEVIRRRNRDRVDLQPEVQSELAPTA